MLLFIYTIRVGPNDLHVLIQLI